MSGAAPEESVIFGRNFWDMYKASEFMRVASRIVVLSENFGLGKTQKKGYGFAPAAGLLKYEFFFGALRYAQDSGYKDTARGWGYNVMDLCPNLYSKCVASLFFESLEAGQHKPLQMNKLTENSAS